MSHEKKLHISMEKLNELPPLSNAARKILEIIYNPDIDVSVFVDVVEQDPVLLGKLIGLANSAYYGNRKITNVERAIIDILGLRTAKNIALGVVLSGIFDTRECPNFKVEEYWINSLFSARLSREFAQVIPEIEPDEAYLCAMLSEIGQMALAFLYPREINKILVMEETEQLSAEVRLFERNHYAISAELLDKWHLPEVVVQVLTELSRQQLDQVSNMTQIIQLSKDLSQDITQKPSIHDEQNYVPDWDSIRLPEFAQVHKIQLEAALTKTVDKLDDFKEMAQLLS